ncbi:MAG: ORF6N domain-containing protein [Deltaproteobacteria bacterium]|nr:ORF6N domain-containing protein [Deltaproteobacteria bacterium]
MAEHSLMKTDDIQIRIYTIRGVQVMLDIDLAEFYGLETKALNQAVKRNIERFPKEFSFQLTSDENNLLRSQIVTLENEDSLRFPISISSDKQSLRSQIVTSNQKGGREYLPMFYRTGRGHAVRRSQRRKGCSDQHSGHQCLRRHAPASGCQCGSVSTLGCCGKKTNRAQGGRRS